MGVHGMFVRLYEAGWTGERLKTMIDALKTDSFDDLDQFAGGELTRAKGSALYPALLEATALRYVLSQSESRGEVKSMAVRSCTHGFVGYCNQCLRESA